MTFTYWGTPLKECDHPYNTTAVNERAVEVPIALHWLQSVRGCGIEVGNVLSHYEVTCDRTVIDKYEHGDEVVNADILECRFRDLGWIVSISTVEHIGFDEQPSVEGESFRAIERMRGFLAPQGRMLVTAPLGYNPPLDEQLLTDSGATRECTMVRTDGRWGQTPNLVSKPYIGGGRGADSVWIGEYS